MRVLTDADVASVLDLSELLETVAEALCKQGEGSVERPDRPHYPVGAGLENDEALGTGLVMPAYVHSTPYFSTKLASVHDGNAERGLPTVNATIALHAADTGLPVAYLAGTRITNARTGCIGGLAARELAVDGPARLGVFGAGPQARWQTRAIDSAMDLERVRIYSPSDSKERCAATLRAEGINAEPVASPEDAVSDATVVVTATTATEPVFDGKDLQTGALVVAIGAYNTEMRELDDRTVDRAAALFADVPSEAAETGDFPEHGEDDLRPFSTVLDGDSGREHAEDVLVVSSVGTAVLDAAASTVVYERAVEREVGTVVEL